MELDRIVERAKHASIDPNAEVDDFDDTEMSMYCITCGHEIHSRTAIKHMEKCFNKVISKIPVQLEMYEICFFFSIV